MDYMRFLKWARRQPGLCSRHRSLICPLCFYASHCLKCKSCTRYNEVPAHKVTLAQGAYRIKVTSSKGLPPLDALAKVSPHPP